MKKNPVGFCSVWSLWYIELRISNPDKDPDDLIDEAITAIRQVEEERERQGHGKGSFTDFIRRYSLKIVRLHSHITEVYRDSSNRGFRLSDGRRKTDGRSRNVRKTDNRRSKKKSKDMKRKRSVAKKTSQFDLKIFDTKSRGKGVKTQTFIKKGSVIIEYGNKRHGKDFDDMCRDCEKSKQWCCPKHNRLMRLPDHTWLDCDSKCLAGYINHSNTKPNCETITVKKNNKMHVYIRATQDITPNTELLYNYYR
jgi:hypothetical protein